MTDSPRLGLFFNYDWDALGFAAHAGSHRFDEAGFDLFSFPSNARIVGFDLERFADQQAQRGRRLGWQGVASHHEQYGALAAALVAERLGLPGTPVKAILACQHKLHARRVLQQVCPEACVRFAGLDAQYGANVPALPEGLQYPVYVKPVKAAFSVLARRIENRAQLQAHTRFGWRELWVIRRLVEPFDRVARKHLPDAGTAHRLLLEEPVRAEQFNLDGWVFKGQAHALGVVDAIMYPGTQAFMRWDHPSRLAPPVQARALDVAQRFLAAVGFTHGLFNMEFFYDAALDRLSVIEFNPRLASQFSDLYQRSQGIDPHAMSLALALGQDPALLPRAVPTAGAVSSLVYRSFDRANTPPEPGAAQRAAFKSEFPDGLLFCFPKHGHSLNRDFKWLGSHRYGIVHLGGTDAADLRRRATAASRLLGWPAPYAAALGAPAGETGWPTALAALTPAAHL
jgi:biotin carboxylase